jgi:hypothetical protein
MPFIARPAAGQIIDPAWGTLVADAVVMRFTTAAQRTSQLTAPVVHQLTMRDDRPGAIERWNGTAWVDLAMTSNLAYAERTTGLAVSAAQTEASPVTVVNGTAVTYDGSTTVEVTFFAPAVAPAAATAAAIQFWLYQDGVSQGRLGYVQTPSAGNVIQPVQVTRRLTPSAGSHTHAIGAAAVTADGNLYCGTGGTGQYVPAFIRVTRV